LPRLILTLQEKDNDQYNERATVEPCVPNALVSRCDKVLLGAYGFSHEMNAAGDCCFYVEESLQGETHDLDPDELNIDPDDDFEVDVKASLEAGDELAGWAEVFRHMIEKSRAADACNPILTEVLVMAAYTYSKMSLHPSHCIRLVRRLMQWGQLLRLHFWCGVFNVYWPLIISGAF
jgi:hypothetical protein